VHVLQKGTLDVWKAVIVPSFGTLAPHGALHKPGETKALFSTVHPIHREDITDWRTENVVDVPVTNSSAVRKDLRVRAQTSAMSRVSPGRASSCMGTLSLSVRIQSRDPDNRGKRVR
jgi:hypothetical protein